MSDQQPYNMAMDPNYINKYLQNFSAINPADVGLYLAEGGQHYVFHYRDDEVIKIPKRSWLMRLYGLYAVKDLEAADLFLNQVFDGYFLDTNVISSDNHRHYAVTQKFLKNAEPLTWKNFRQVKDQFEKLAELNRRLLHKHHMTLDFISFHGFFICIKALLLHKKESAVMENLMVYSNNGKPELKIIDSNLLNLRPGFSKRINPVHWLTDHIFYWGSKILIKGNFGVAL